MGLLKLLFVQHNLERLGAVLRAHESRCEWPLEYGDMEYDGNTVTVYSIIHLLRCLFPKSANPASLAFVL